MKVIANKTTNLFSECNASSNSSVFGLITPLLRGILGSLFGIIIGGTLAYSLGNVSLFFCGTSIFTSFTFTPSLSKEGY